jgi:hypothetical protein
MRFLPGVLPQQQLIAVDTVHLFQQQASVRAALDRGAASEVFNDDVERPECVSSTIRAVAPAWAKTHDDGQQTTINGSACDCRQTTDGPVAESYPAHAGT